MSKPGRREDAGSPKRRRSLDACSKWKPLTAGGYEAGADEGAGHSCMRLSPPQHSCLLHTGWDTGQLLKSTVYTKHGICIIWSGYFVSGKYLRNAN